MISVRVIAETATCHLWQVVYYMEGVAASTLKSTDRQVIEKEVSRLLSLEMGLAKGKTFTAGMEKGLK